MSEPKFKIGDKVKIVKQMGSVHLPLGTILTLKSYSGYGWRVVENGYDYQDAEFGKIEMNLADLEAEAQKLKSKIEEINAKIAWMRQMGLELFDEEEFKISQVIRLVQSQPTADMVTIRQVKNLLKEKPDEN